MARGRKTKYTPELVESLSDYIAEGNTNKTACALVGIDDSTFYAWMSQKKDFSETIKKAQQQAVRRNLEVIQLAARKNWTAAAWWLERLHPEEFGNKTKSQVELTGKDGGPVEVDLGITDETFVNFANAITTRERIGEEGKD